MVQKKKEQIYYGGNGHFNERKTLIVLFIFSPPHLAMYSPLVPIFLPLLLHKSYENALYFCETGLPFILLRLNRISFLFFFFFATTRNRQRETRERFRLKN